MMQIGKKIINKFKRSDLCLTTYKYSITDMNSKRNSDSRFYKLTETLRRVKLRLIIK